jgi:predicted transcriptional regulator of viral defense system
MRSESLLSALPPVFSYSQARRPGVGHSLLYRWRDSGVIEAIGRGVFRKVDAGPGDLTLIEAVSRAPRATMCLTSALVFHDLLDTIPLAVDLAVPRGTRFPQVAGRVTWHAFDAARFDLGREVREIEEGLLMGVYDAERTIVDTFRLRHHQGEDEAYEALRRWLRRRSTSPAVLLAMAGNFPRTVPVIRQALVVLQ